MSAYFQKCECLRSDFFVQFYLWLANSSTVHRLVRCYSARGMPIVHLSSHTYTAQPAISAQWSHAVYTDAPQAKHSHTIQILLSRLTGKNNDQTQLERSKINWNIGIKLWQLYIKKIIFYLHDPTTSPPFPNQFERKSHISGVKIEDRFIPLHCYNSKRTALQRLNSADYYYYLRAA